jgi:hypothetical protein
MRRPASDAGYREVRKAVLSCPPLTEESMAEAMLLNPPLTEERPLHASG